MNKIAKELASKIFEGIAVLHRHNDNLFLAWISHDFDIRKARYVNEEDVREIIAKNIKERVLSRTECNKDLAVSDINSYLIERGTENIRITFNKNDCKVSVFELHPS